MPTLDNTQKKTLLKNPVDAYERLHPQGEHLKNIIELVQLQEQLKSQLKAHEIEKRQLSRKIGAAKKQKHDASALIQEMQSQSESVKTFQSELKQIETQIISFFEYDLTTPDSAIVPTTVEKRNYADDKFLDINDITIFQLAWDSTEIINSWNTYVENNPSCSIYHRSEWRDIIKSSFGHESFYFYASDTHDKIRGVLPVTRLKSKLFGDFMVSIPYFNYGGAIADSAAIEQKLIQTVNDFAADMGVSHVEYRDDTQRIGMPVRDEKVCMLLALPSDKQTLWESFTPKLRAQIKRPQRENVTTTVGDIELLDDYYNVFSRNMRDLGTPVYSKTFFENILNNKADACKIIIVRLNDKPVAAAFLIGHKNTLEIPWASTLKETNHLSINMLLYWEVLGYAIDKHYHYFDFGRSSKDAGTYRFKKQWGSIEKPLYWHYWLKDNNDLPELNPNNPKYKLMIALWKKLPLIITKLIGPAVVKNLP
ncbi:MAG: FemAB family PEP-CTERM system-associated protein [Gammaproteobacteria bacterium]|nr:FemAB family PEP-CTERM system-associated protein [Gammaproteobacteria bacterium]